MENKIKGGIFFLALFVYLLIFNSFSNLISSSLNYLLWGLWIILILIYFYWLSKNTDFFRKKDSIKSTAQHRVNTLDEMGIFKGLLSFIQYSGLIFIGLGIYAFFSNHQDKIQILKIFSIIGLIAFFAGYFFKKKIKKK